MRVIDIAWGGTKQTMVDASIGRDEVVAFRFKTPADVSGKKGNISLAEYNSPQCPRTGSLSTVAGDMKGLVAFVDNPAPRVYFHGSGPWPNEEHKHKAPGEGPQLQPNTEYFLNVSNSNPQAGVDSFGVRVTLTPFGR